MKTGKQWWIDFGTYCLCVAMIPVILWLEYVIARAVFPAFVPGLFE